MLAVDFVWNVCRWQFAACVTVSVLVCHIGGDRPKCYLTCVN